MTKQIKSAYRWYQKMKVWSFILYIVTPVTAGGEIAVLLANGDQIYHWIVAGAGVLTGGIKFFAKDENNDGIIDGFQEDQKP